MLYVFDTLMAMVDQPVSNNPMRYLILLTFCVIYLPAKHQPGSQSFASKCCYYQKHRQPRQDADHK